HKDFRLGSDKGFELWNSMGGDGVTVSVQTNIEQEERDTVHPNFVFGSIKYGYYLKVLRSYQITVKFGPGKDDSPRGEFMLHKGDIVAVGPRHTFKVNTSAPAWNYGGSPDSARF